MKRRDFLLGGAAAGWPNLVRAQQPARVRRVGVLMGIPKDDPQARQEIVALEGGLRQLGWMPGRNLHIEYRWAGTMGFARDGRPLVGWLDASHHLAICAGFTGHGMGMATACTQDLAELLSWKRAPGISTFDPQRFPELLENREGIVALGVHSG